MNLMNRATFIIFLCLFFKTALWYHYCFLIPFTTYWFSWNLYSHYLENIYTLKKIIIQKINSHKNKIDFLFTRLSLQCFILPISLERTWGIDTYVATPFPWDSRSFSHFSPSRRGKYIYDMIVVENVWKPISTNV
jgi:hypothetical protein